MPGKLALVRMNGRSLGLIASSALLVVMDSIIPVCRVQGQLQTPVSSVHYTLNTNPHIHPPTHTHTHTHTHTLSYPPTHIHPPTHPPAHTHTHTLSYPPTHIHTHSPIHMYSATHSPIHTCTHLPTHPSHPQTLTVQIVSIVLEHTTIMLSIYWDRTSVQSAMVAAVVDVIRRIIGVKAITIPQDSL